jgi:hypothetical protein
MTTEGNFPPRQLCLKPSLYGRFSLDHLWPLLGDHRGQHRMACAKCDFYMPKESTAALLLEGKSHLLRLLQEIPLGEAEQAAVEDGITAYEHLLSKLADVPTPAGPTPRQIGAGLVQITSVLRSA